MRPVLLAALLLSDRALAFCGTYVSSYEEAPTNAASEVAIVRQGNRTTLTVANDVQGDTRDFAMVIPVPEILGEDQIHVVDPAVFDSLRGYSNPREVSYDCEDFAYDEDSADTASDSDADTDADSDSDTDTVEIEAQYVVGEYDVLILSAEESGGLVTWLQTNGYNVPDTSAELLGEYMDAGAYFFAAQVREDAAIESGAMLSPLQFSYTSEPFGLPVRIGTLNSPGEQDLRIYAFTDYDQGAVGIANYSEVEIDHDCMWEPAGAETLTEYYDRQLDDAFGNIAGAEWITEYSWGNGSCDPCTGVIPSESDVYTLGYQDDYHYGQYYWFTRLRMRYSPDTADQDLVLYETRTHEMTQMRFIQYEQELEEYFPVCNVGWIEDGGTCDEFVPDPGDDDDDESWLEDLFDGDDDDGDGINEVGSDGCGCASPGTPGAPLLAGLLAAGVAVARRRRGA